MAHPSHPSESRDARERIVQVARAYRHANEVIEEERFQRLRELSEEELWQHFGDLLDLGAPTLPRTPEEWAEFESTERELVAFQRNAIAVRSKLARESK